MALRNEEVYLGYGVMAALLIALHMELYTVQMQILAQLH